MIRFTRLLICKLQAYHFPVEFTRIRPQFWILVIRFDSRSSQPFLAKINSPVSITCEHYFDYGLVRLKIKKIWLAIVGGNFVVVKKITFVLLW